jgi:hypothetical protein
MPSYDSHYRFLFRVFFPIAVLFFRPSTSTHLFAPPFLNFFSVFSFYLRHFRILMSHSMGSFVLAREGV